MGAFDLGSIVSQVRKRSCQGLTFIYASGWEGGLLGSSGEGRDFWRMDPSRDMAGRCRRLPPPILGFSGSIGRERRREKRERERERERERGLAPVELGPVKMDRAGFVFWVLQVYT